MKPANRKPAASAGANAKLLKVIQAAELTQISVREIRRLIRSGELPVRRFGRAVRIHPKDLGL
jgi:excisionase family DNA binding protein